MSPSNNGTQECEERYRLSTRAPYDLDSSELRRHDASRKRILIPIRRQSRKHKFLVLLVLLSVKHLQLITMLTVYDLKTANHLFVSVVC